MDPNKTLALIREHAAILNGDGSTTEEVVQAGLDMAEAFADLDNWILRGGFLPREWAPGAAA